MISHCKNRCHKKQEAATGCHEFYLRQSAVIDGRILHRGTRALSGNCGRMETWVLSSIIPDDFSQWLVMAGLVLLAS